MDRGIPTEEMLPRCARATRRCSTWWARPRAGLTELGASAGRPALASRRARRAGQAACRRTGELYVFAAEPRSRRQGAGDAPAAAQAAVGAAQAAPTMKLTREELLMKLGAARQQAPGAWRLVDGRGAADSATFTYRLEQQAAAGAAARRPVSAAHQPDRDRPGQALDVLPATGRGRGGLQEPQGRPGAAADLPPEEARIEAHIFVAFLAYCLHVTLGQRLQALAPGLTPRSVLEKFAAVQMIDVHIPTTDGREDSADALHQPEARARSCCWSKLETRVAGRSQPPKITADPGASQATPV